MASVIYCQVYIKYSFSSEIKIIQLIFFLLYFNSLAEHEVSFILNLCLDGYSIGKPTEVC